MENVRKNKYKYIWFIVIVFISLSLVGVALAAANAAGKSITAEQFTPSPSQNAGQPVASLPASPFRTTPEKQQEVYTPGDPTGELMRQQAMANSAPYSDPDANLLAEIYRVEFWKQPSADTSIWGGVEPFSPVTITTSSGDVLTTTADMDGEFSTPHATELFPNDIITVTSGAGEYPVVILFPDMFANSDSNIDQVIGHISYPFWELEIHPWWDAGVVTTTTNVDGNFWVTFDDIPPNGRGYLRFMDTIQPDDVQVIFHAPFYDVDPTIVVNYGHDWIEGNYDSGWQVAITVTNEAGEVKGVAYGETGIIPYWGGNTGFATHDNVDWQGQQPDIQVTDFVYLHLERPGEVRTEEVQVGEISGEVDTHTDTFSGSLNIPWLVDPVWVDCGVWIENGPGMGVGDIDPNGGTFTCDFASIGFDLLPGMDVGVSYYESDADQVINVFNEPAPHLYANLETFGQPAFGNNYMFRLHFNNDGWATAPDVTLSQEFYGMTYLYDTSPYPHTGTGAPGDPVVWDIGGLPYNHMNETWFDVFVSIDDYNLFTLGDIHTSMQYYQGDYESLHFEWGTDDVLPNDAALNIGKWAWTWGVAPGQEFVYAVNVCNYGTTSSSDVYITDTLPTTTTLVSWFANQPGWEEVSAAPHELVVKRATLPPDGWCSEVYVKVLLDAQALLYSYLWNEAEVWSESDTTPEDNAVYFEHMVLPPEYNLHLTPNWVNGMFVPGGEVGIEVNLENWGNMPINGTVITTTIPDGVEYISAYTWDWSEWSQITPTIVADDYLRWDLGEFENGYSRGYGIRFRILDDTQVGATLVFENRFMGDALEYRYDDNVVIYTETVNDYGPNLRVDKHTNWWWNAWWEGDIQYMQLGYELRILNIGTEYLENVVITDTFPISTTMNPDMCWWNHGPGDLQPCEVDEVNHQVIFKLAYLNPGETASAGFNVNLAPEDVGVQGLAFTNQAEISNYDDIDLEDNFDEVTSYTGPDVFVRKWLKEGEVQAGRLITYTVEFGNLNKWPLTGDQNFGSHITETLPEGMTFVDAIGYWDPSLSWEPESVIGQQVVWSWGTMWPYSTWTFDLVVQIDEGVPPGSELLNTIEAWGDSPTDIDVNPANNLFEYPLTTIIFRQLMPFMLNYP